MDKYEYKLKLDQIKALAAEGSYEAAAEIADTINWRKVRNVNLLVKAADVYTKQKRYEEAREILFLAYDRSPIRRMIVYRLAEIAVRMKNLKEAEEYYNEFVESAPHDNLRYVLRFKISRAKGEDIQTLIAILEELKESEYTEEWAYQLAYLYHKAGEGEKCIEACDELALWFGDGIYVERALELKMLYQPLTKSQEGKYLAFKQRRDGIKEVYPQEEENVVRIPVVQESTEKFNTANLQEELAKSMQQIMDATEQETVDDTMDSIKKMVEDIPYLQMPNHEAAAQGMDAPENVGEDGAYSIRDSYKEILAEDRDGQYHMLVEDGVKEPQIDGQMSIQDVLSDWEKTGRAIQAAIQMAQQQKLESAKAKALQEVGDVMERLVEVMPELDEGVAAQFSGEEELLKENASYEERTGQLVANANTMLQQQIDRLQGAIGERTAGVSEQETAEDEKAPELLRRLKSAKPNFDEQIGLRPYRPRQFLKEEQLSTVQEQHLAQQPKEEAKRKEDRQESEELLWGMTEEELLREKRLAEAEFYGVSPEELPIEPERPHHTPEELAQDAETLQKQPEEEMPQIALPEDVAAEAELLRQDTKEMASKKIEAALREKDAEKQPEEPEPAQIEKHRKITKLNEEQKEIFSYFVPVEGMESQICRILTNTSARLAAGKTSSSGHILIQGESGCGKTVLAKSLIKALQKEVGCPNGKVGKIDAKALNKKDISKLFGKIEGGCLIIERAADLDRETAVKLSLLLDADQSGILLIMEDNRSGLERALGQDEGLAKKFTERVKIPVFTSDELVEFGKAYAHDNDYEIDNMGVLALYNRISNIQRIDRATTLTEVKEIIDGAIEKAEKKSIKKAFSILTARRYTEDDYVLLKEKDFEE